MQGRKNNANDDFAVAGALVDKMGQYFHVFFVCSVVVISAAIFLIVSFSLLDRRSSQCSRGLGEPPGRTVADVAPGCQYKSVPTQGDKEKMSPPTAVCSASV